MSAAVPKGENRAMPATGPTAAMTSAAPAGIARIGAEIDAKGLLPKL